MRVMHTDELRLDKVPELSVREVIARHEVIKEAVIAYGVCLSVMAGLACVLIFVHFS